ncbi:hypothetical protein C8R44DRAFT_879088 [Mycena epipterygia]|nr:hypothetical protein C8R44DRAFT_879088 [Mycena epipterygia]
MSHTDATEALAIYHHFCIQTEHGVEYRRRTQAAVCWMSRCRISSIPPSPAGAPQEYLDDPAFEQNRIEYRMNKEAAKRRRGARPYPHYRLSENLRPRPQATHWSRTH